MSRKSSSAKTTPGTATTSVRTRPRTIDCAAAILAPRASRSPMRRATIAVVAMPVPMATAKRIVIMASVRPIVATASVPRRETKKASVRAKTDSITISRTMGMASRTMARPIGPEVNSSSLPVRANLTVAQAPSSGGTSTTAIGGSSSDLMVNTIPKPGQPRRRSWVQ